MEILKNGISLTILCVIVCIPPQPTPIYVNIRVFDFHINKYTGRAPYMPFKALQYLYTIGGGVFSQIFDFIRLGSVLGL